MRTSSPPPCPIAPVCSCPSEAASQKMRVSTLARPTERGGDNSSTKSVFQIHARIARYRIKHNRYVTYWHATHHLVARCSVIANRNGHRATIDKLKFKHTIILIDAVDIDARIEIEEMVSCPPNMGVCVRCAIASVSRLILMLHWAHAVALYMGESI